MPSEHDTVHNQKDDRRSEKHQSTNKRNMSVMVASGNEPWRVGVLFSQTGLAAVFGET